jgi:hypothetical protein
VTAPNAYSNPITSWRNPNGSGSFSYAEDCCGPLSYSNPEWWGSGRLLITHDGATIGSQPNFTFYNLATGSNTGWSGDQAIGSSGASQVTVSRNGLLYAIETDDGYDHNGTIQNVSITLETGNTPPNSFGSTTSITAGCKITLPASAFATNHGASEISMSFSSDGKTLAWGQDDGVYEANVSDPSNCGNVAGSVHRVVAGGQMPFLGAAALSPANPAPKPGPTPPGPTPPAPCCGPNPGLTGPPSTAISGFHLNRHSHSAAVRFRGSGGTGSLSFRCKLDGGRWMRCRSPQRYRHLRKGRHTFQVVAIDHRGTVDRTPAKRRFSV